jgi:hypothetical protein
MFHKLALKFSLAAADKFNDKPMTATTRRRIIMTYRKIETTNIINTVESALTGLGNVDHKKFSGRGTKHMHQWQLDGCEMKVAGDMVTPRIVLYNSYDRECALSLHIGFLRWVCNNGMYLGHATYATRIIHREGAVLEQKLEDLYTGVAAAISYITDGQFEIDMRELRVKRLTREQMFRIVAQLPELSNRSKDQMIRQLLRNDRRTEDMSDNVWTLWNMANENLRLNSRGNEVRLAERNNNLLNNIMQLAA